METLNKPKPMRLHLILNILEKDQCFISTKKKERETSTNTEWLWGRFYEDVEHLKIKVGIEIIFTQKLIVVFTSVSGSTSSRISQAIS